MKYVIMTVGYIVNIVYFIYAVAAILNILSFQITSSVQNLGISEDEPPNFP